MNKTLIALITLTLTTLSCGEKDKVRDYVFTEEYAVIYEEYVSHPKEAQDILRYAIRAQNGSIWDYHKTKWFTHEGHFLFKSIIINDETFKLETKQ